MFSLENSLCDNRETCSEIQARQVIFWQVLCFLQKTGHTGFDGFCSNLVSQKSWIFTGNHIFLPNTKVVREFKQNNSALLCWKGFCWKLFLPAYFVRILHFSVENSFRDNLERCSGTLHRQLFFSQVFLFTTENPSYQGKTDLTVSAQSLLSLFLLLAWKYYWKRRR
jgi:hypothetical protein